MSNLNELRDYYDNNDMSDVIADATPEDPVEEVLVSTSIRLTKAVMDRVRSRAEEAGVPATTLMRQWIIDRLDGVPGDAVVTVADLEQFIATRSHRVAS